MHLAIVGAGAVGLVYGRHAALAGARVTFVVRPHHRERLADGVWMYPLNDRGARDEGVLFDQYDVVTDYSAVADLDVDATVLCMSATGLRGDWLPVFAQALPNDAIVVTLQPGPEDRALVDRTFGPERVVSGLITMASWPAPLPGESVPHDGYAYYFPPLSRFPFDGPSARVEPIVDLFNRGGMPSKAADNLAAQSGFPSAVMMPFLVGLETHGWNPDALVRSDRFGEVIATIREALAVASAHSGEPVPLPMRAVGPWTLRVIYQAARIAAPFDLDRFLEVHFTKVGDQTLLFLDTYARLAEDHDLPHVAIDRSRERLREARGLEQSS